MTTLDYFKRQLHKPEATFFDDDAQKFAEQLAQYGKKGKPTQLRRFYDQLQQLEQRINGDEEKLALYLPEIRMISAHLAYAKGRELISDEFCQTMQNLIRSINTCQHLKNGRLFFEATLGFLRAIRRD
ncbi:type III-A CRISPR-associated protein Csm2 [Prodigiosinella confusarubida]|uniref:CRISPR system Cms protein Csm2 n=1 Tax=Serratia sp. (strain ATCC 39006) TaxID=104623 RepID=A0A2I5TBC8_SERS3|nr:type III-A CRISPR-associated protein Csm2 [Serratia sp. ATCC 39006]AUH01866.1 type III-A CRISPR-associated protein Csm2 [Serratia sp. ATCC 39006]AUH06188.1 type III-A CRISPR-associated protein Csm2 [Serratia sp. ATCC 39006]